MVVYTQRQIEAAIGLRPIFWARNCHVVSLAIVKAKLYPSARVARGWCEGVTSQHSWVVIGNNCMQPDAILDCTLWSYDERVPKVYYPEEQGRYHPHGEGWIDTDLCPERTGAVVRLPHLTKAAKAFLDELSPGGLDIRQWHWLASHAALQGWPARDVYTAMCRRTNMRVLIPVDRVGMMTDLNPGGLYL